MHLATCACLLAAAHGFTHAFPSASSHRSRAAFAAHDAHAAAGSAPPAEALLRTDPEVAALCAAEAKRQSVGLELIASENFASGAVRAALASCFTNKYSEGLPGKRYYGGNEHVDGLERLCQARALALYGLSPAEWGVNVQPYSGSPANFAALTALLEPGDRLMGLDLPSGGHLTHGYETKTRKVSATSKYFTSLPYRVSGATGLVDYDELACAAAAFRPKLLIAGASAYPRDWDYARMREIADAAGAFLMTDMAHLSGLVATGLAESPFAHSDVVTTTTHKTLRGPRAGLVFYRRALGEAVNAAVFPALQGGPHNNNIAAVAVALKEAAAPEFAAYQRCVVANARAMAAALVARGHAVATGGTDNHIVLWDLRPFSITGSKVEALLEACGLTANKNSVPGDVSAVAPGGVRLGSAALTTRGASEDDFAAIGALLDDALRLALEVQAAVPGGSKKLVDFRAEMGAAQWAGQLGALRERAEGLAKGLRDPEGL